MKAKITRELLRDLKPASAVIDIIDTDLRGFIARMSPSGTITYGIRYSNQDGRQCRYSLGRTFPATTVSAAREEARIVLGKIAAGMDPAEDERAKRRQVLTLGKFLDEQYAKWLQVNTRTGPHIAARLKASFSEHLDRPLHEFNAWLIEKWRSEKMKAGMSASTTNRNITALRGLFSRAVEWGAIQSHPLSSVKMLREPGGKVRWLSDDEEVRLRAALTAREARERACRTSANEWRAARKYDLLPALAQGQFVDHLRPMVLLSLNTGARQGELTKLRWESVDLDNAVMTFKGDTTKSGSTRHIPLNSEALDTLRTWKKQSTGLIVFPGRSGGELVEVKTAWANLLKEAKIGAFRWHDMRHHFASRLVMAGVDLNTVRELLGHSDLKMTLRYSHLAPEHKAAAVQKLMKTK
ncbi:tyrosine-type recombinase/integrase [Massilia sp. CCM 8695]|uniref:Tyrosine-type recombinase/integrase n=1 Tax=Massilia frigida TaxID=2609281 RepID=A0ABX0NG85_9BURK|nr:site-specific integrase [Massilia frigida]NHZ81861.1 tyrosine-type recombinase/integrase [Massilia frigida]